MILAAALSVVMGVVLGLLGGGGSILTLPILLYAVGVGAKEAIATSLVVVGVTSLVGVLHHARMGNVRWRTGLIFGAAGMVGAYGGGLLAAHIDGDVLLMLFAGLMVVSAIGMLRGRKGADDAGDGPENPASARPFKAAHVVGEGLVVGAVTGLMGAGGGFLVVPALVLFGGLGMRAAVGTSLLVISLKSFAGVAGHLSHASIDWQLAALVTGAAVVGAFVGAALSARVKPAMLRRAFAVLVLGMAIYIVRQEAPAAVIDAFAVDGWLLWAGVGGVVCVVLALVLRPRGDPI